MTALEEIKKAFPNMFRLLKWHHFDGPTEHGCGEWYAHATRGMHHIYDVREKFPNDRPFYAKELSDQFDTLEQAQDAVQNRHELDIVMCLHPDFRSTIESLQRENEALRRDRYDLAYAITGGEDAPGLLDTVPTTELVEIARSTHRSHSADIARAEAAEAELDSRTRALDDAEAEVKRYRVALIAAKTRMRNCRGAIESNQVVDKDVHGSLQNGIRDIQEALASTGGEHHADK